nr:60s ribosomal protein l7 [Hymenolepis microstoma]
MEERIGEEKSIAKLPTIPVRLLKRRKQANKDVIKAQLKRSSDIHRRARERRGVTRRPAHFIATARKEARDQKRLERVCTRKTPITFSDRLGIVIRLHGDNGLSTESKQVLQILNLHAPNTAVFVRVSEAMLKLLTVVCPYVAWGYADLATVRGLVFKRGKTKVGNKIRSIDNAVVEEKLGSLGILCIEDLIHELITLGPHLREVLGFVCPFRLRAPTGDWKRHLKRAQHPFNHTAANRYEMISELIQKVV